MIPDKEMLYILFIIFTLLIIINDVNFLRKFQMYKTKLFFNRIVNFEKAFCLKKNFFLLI